MAEDNAELANFNSKLAQQMNDVSAAKDKHINDLKTRLDNTTKECKKLAKQLAINGHQIDEFQKKKEYERETYSAQNLGITKDLRIAQATLKDLRDKVEASEEQTKMIYLQNSTLKEKLSSSKGNLKRSQELYAHSMHEKSKVTVNENEYKKQLISMTSTIDSLAEDKDGLLTKLKGLGQDIADVRDQLNYQTEANKKLSLQANEAISLHMEKENILEDKIHTLEQEANKVPRDANLNISPEAMNLKETNRRLRQQVVDLEGKLASQKRRISSERNREIQENKAEAEYQLIQLNSELNGLQETISYQSITNGKLNTQNKELRTNVSQAKKEAQRLATERGALMTNVHEQQNICKAQSEEQVQELLSKNQTLERELVNIQGYVMQGRNTNVELQRVLEDKRRAEAELAEVAGAMEECRREAVNSKSEVQRVCAEMDNYAQILEAMEGKVNEAEDKVNHAERVREEAIGEIHAIRQRYINALK